MNEIRTSGSKVTPPWGAFDDYIILESIDTNERVLIRPEEFQFLTSELFNNWKKGKSKYVQFLREWNECTGFNDLDENPSILLDIKDSIEAIKLITGVDKPEHTKLTNTDIKLIIDFLIKNENNKIKIWKDF